MIYYCLNIKINNIVLVRLEVKLIKTSRYIIILTYPANSAVLNSWFNRILFVKTTHLIFKGQCIGNSQYIFRNILNIIYCHGAIAVLYATVKCYSLITV